MGITPAPPYDPDAEPPQDPFAGGPAQEHATWGDRLGAAVIDFFVRLTIVALCAGLGALAYVGGNDAGEIGLVAGICLGMIITWFVYAPAMMARTGGQTVGHRATSTRVVMADGSRMSGGRAFLREAIVKGLLIETIGSFTLYILPLVNYLFPLWDKNSEALHDKICSTRVVPA